MSELKIKKKWIKKKRQETKQFVILLIFQSLPNSTGFFVGYLQWEISGSERARSFSLSSFSSFSYLFPIFCHSFFLLSTLVALVISSFRRLLHICSPPPRPKKKEGNKFTLLPWSLYLKVLVLFCFTFDWLFYSK